MIARFLIAFFVTSPIVSLASGWLMRHRGRRNWIDFDGSRRIAAHRWDHDQ